MRTPTRVLYLTTSGQIGGAERCLASLIAGLDRREFEATVLVGSPGPFYQMLLRQQRWARLMPLPNAMRRLSRYHRNRGLWARVAPLLELPGYLLRLRRAGVEAEPQLVHSNGVKMHYLSALLKRSWGAPLIWHLHDFPAERRNGSEPWPNRLLQRLSGRVDAAIANSEAVARAYRERLPRLGPKLRVAPNGVSLTEMEKGDRGGMRRRLGLESGDFVIGMVAIFAPWKGQEVFLEAARRVHRRAPEVRFALIGDDIYDTRGHGGRRAQLERKARELGIAEVVRFSGFVDEEIASAYAALDVMVHASTAPEPFGRTAIEAMAAGVPVIAAAAGGMLEVVEEGESGLLTAPGEAAALAAAMQRLYQDTELRRRLSEGGKRRVQERFSEAAVGRVVAAIYRELLGGVRT